MKTVHVVVVSDSTLMLNNRDGTNWSEALRGRIRSELWRKHKGLQVPNWMDFNFQHFCHPGAELSDLTVTVNNQLRAIQNLNKDVITVCVLVWSCNDITNHRKKSKRGKVTYFDVGTAEMETVSKAAMLMNALLREYDAAVVIGPGCAQRWQVDERWGEIAFNIAKIFDVPVINPLRDYDDLESPSNDSWHFIQHPDTVERFVPFIDCINSVGVVKIGRAHV